MTRSGWPARLLVLQLALLAAILAGRPATPAEPRPDRDVRLVQEALIWTGDFTGVVNGLMGPRTREAVAAYLKRTGSSGTDTLDPEARAHLLAEAQAKRRAVGFAPVVDKKAGLELGLPMKVLTKETGTDSGTRFSSADGGIVVDTLARPATGAGLPDVFARMSATGVTRKVIYKLLRPDFFVVSGETGDRSFYSRFAQGKAEGVDTVRGFTVTYPKAAAARLDPVALAMAASFNPFPAASEGNPATADAQGHATPSSPAAASSGATPTFSTAVLVGPGVAISRASTTTCATPTVDGKPASYRFDDQRTGLAILAVPGGSGALPLRVAAEPVRRGDTLVGLFHGRSDDAGHAGPLLTAAVEVRQVDGPAGVPLRVWAPFQARGEGPPLFDRSGALAALAEPDASAPPAVDGTVLERDYRASGPAEIRALLDKAGIPSGTAEVGPDLGLGELVSVLRPSVLVVSCSSGNAGVR